MRHFAKKMKNIKAKYRVIFALKGLNKKGKGLIQIEVDFNRKSRKFISTGIYIEKKEWDAKNCIINASHQNFIRLNDLIKTRIAEMETYELDLIRQGKPFSPDSLNKFINFVSDDFHALAKHSVEFDGKLNEKSRTRVLAELDFFNKIVGPVALIDLDYNKIKQFDKWLKDQKYHTNTIGKYHKDIKRCINALIREGEMEINPYAKFPITKVKTRRDYLTAADIEKLAALSYSTKMQETLDRFLISCGTALRFSDCFMLHSKQVYQGDADKGLVVDLERMVKVEYPVKNPAYIYFNGIADQRLRKYLNGEGYLFYKKGQSADATNAKDNQNLKLIAMDAGINKELSFHSSRHSALTEVAIQTGNVFSVMKFGGIRKVDTAMIYIHLASEKF